MGLWNLLFTLLEATGLGSPVNESKAPIRAPVQPTARSSPSPQRRPQAPSHAPGERLHGTVEYVDRKFVKVRAGQLVATVFLAEINERFLESASEALSVGDAVEFVLLRSDQRGWKASIAAAAEARAREALASLQEGGIVEGKVEELRDREVRLDCGSFQMRVPLAEVDWRGLDHPSQALSFGERVSARVVSVHAPEDWLENKRARCAHAVGSIRACREAPVSPMVPMAFAAVAVRLWARPKIPRRCDPVVLYVLESLAAAVPSAEIATTTRLSAAALKDIGDILVAAGLVCDSQPTAAGRRLLESNVRATQFNETPAEGLFSSTAPAELQLLSMDNAAHDDTYPQGRPRPAHDEGRVLRFLRAADEAVPEWLMAGMARDEAERRRLAVLQSDLSIRVLLRRNVDSPRRLVRLDVPEHWLLAGLWAGFEPVGSPPFRPPPERDGCGHFVMLRLAGSAQEQEDGAYLEPHTVTLWRPRHGRARVRQAKPWSDSAHGLSSGCLQALSSAAERGLRPDQWCSVRIAGARRGD